MPYKMRIKVVADAYRLLTEQISAAKKSNNSALLEDLIRQQGNMEKELKRLDRLQWDEDNERVDMDDR